MEKKFIFLKSRKLLLSAFLALTAALMLAFGFTMVFGGVTGVKEADAAATLIANYQFTDANNPGYDSTGNYHLKNGTVASYSSAGLEFSPTAVMAYYTANNAGPETNSAFSAGAAFTITSHVFIKNNGGGSNLIFGTGFWGDGLCLKEHYGQLQFGFNGTTVGATHGFGTTGEWARVTARYSSGTVTVEVHATKTGTTNKATADLGASYKLSNGIASSATFCINGRCNASGGGNAEYVGSSSKYTGQRISDLRFYSGNLTDLELKRMYLEDQHRIGYDSSATLVANYDFMHNPFSLGTDKSGYQYNLNLNGNTYNGTRNGLGFNLIKSTVDSVSKGNVVTAQNLGSNWDFTDKVLVRCKFSITMRAFVLPGYQSIGGTGINHAYYLLAGGQWGSCFDIQANWGSIYMEYGSGSAKVGQLFFENIIPTNGAYMRFFVTYDGTTLTGKVIREGNALDGSEDQPFTQTASVSQANCTLGGDATSYSFSLGGQSVFNGSSGNDAQAYYTDGNTGFSRTGVAINDLRIWRGVYDQESEINTYYNSLRVTEGSTSSYTKVAHYAFSDSSDLGLDSSGNGYNLTNGGVTVDSVNGGVKLDAYADSTTSTYNNRDHVLAAPKDSTSGFDFSDKYRGAMSISFRLYQRTLSSGGHLIFSSTRGYGTYDYNTGLALEVSSSNIYAYAEGAARTFAGALTSGTTARWYRVTMIYTPSTSLRLLVHNQWANTVSDNTVALTGSGTGFGGNLDYGFTIGGQSQYGSNVDWGASDSQGATGFSPSIDDFRVYSGIINTDEINNILTSDTTKMKLVSDNSAVSGTLGTDIGMNYYFGMPVASVPTVTYTYNAVSQEKSVVATLSDASTNKYLINITGIAAQDIGSIITIKRITYSYNDTTRSLDLNSWAKTTYSAKAYYIELLNTYGENSTTGHLAIAMLNYGAAAQRKLSFNAENLANSDLTDSQKAYTRYDSSLIVAGGDIYDNAVRNLSGTKAANVIWASGSVFYNNRIGIGMKLIISGLSGSDEVAVKIYKNDALVKTLAADDMESYIDGNGRTVYKPLIEGISVLDLTDVYTFKVFINDVESSQSVNYNAYGYILSFMQSTAASGVDGALAKALYTVCICANEYVA